MFLICTPREVDYFLQQLIVSSSIMDGNHRTTHLHDWARGQKTNWSDLLIESLCIAQCNNTLQKLGLDLDNLRLYYFPHRPEIVTHVQSILKLLYLMCEKLDVEQCSQMITSITRSVQGRLSNIDIFLHRSLEVHLLHWISCGILEVFNKNNLNLQVLMTYFKSIDNLDMYDFLKFNMDRERQMKIVTNPNVRDEVYPSSSQSISSIVSLKGANAEENYAILPDTPGILLIINQYEFEWETDPKLNHLLPEKKLDDRKGTEKDVQALEATFSKFNYRITVKHNLNHENILREIKNVIKIVSRLDCSLFVAILSHGIEGCVYGSNSIPVEVRDIKSIFYDHADNLLGKPKVLIIQACQGGNLQIARSNNAMQLQSDSPALIPNQAVVIPPCSDFLIAWSTVEGYASLRHILKGTWFIQTLCETITSDHES